MGQILEVIQKLSSAEDIHFSVAVQPNKNNDLVGFAFVGDRQYDLTLENFKLSFAVDQTMRDIAGVGLPDRLLYYKQDAARPLVITLDGDRAEFSTGRLPKEAEILPAVGRAVTSSAP